MNVQSTYPGSISTVSPTETLQTKPVVPLFQVEYDRSQGKPLDRAYCSKICRPKAFVTQHRKLNETKSCNLSCSPLPSPLDISPSPLPVTDKNTIFSAVKLRPKKPVAKQMDCQQNALTVFEFSTVYPFIYSNNKFKCFVCSQPFLETSLLRHHMNESHTFAPLKIMIHNRKKDNILKVDVGDIMCKLCTLKPSNLTELKAHLKNDHSKLIDPDLQDNIIPFKLDGGGGTYQCVVCHESFLKVRILVIHMSVHFKNYSCEICGSGFMTLRLLKKHLEVHETGNYPCDKCSKVFTTPQKRSLHNRGVHLKLYPRRCPICPERFNSNYRRTIHLQDVHNQSTRVHKCESCGKSFNLKYHLICHVRSVHLQERNQQCDQCLQRFCNKETLKRHMVIHTGEKKYKCEVCGMAFLRRKNLKDHMRLHDVV